MINAQLEQAFRRNKLNASLSPFWRSYRKPPLAGFADASIANLLLRPFSDLSTPENKQPRSRPVELRPGSWVGSLSVRQPD